MEAIRNGDLVQGDILEIGGKEYMLLGIDEQGGPGRPFQPEPVFGTSEPTVLR